MLLHELAHDGAGRSAHPAATTCSACASGSAPPPLLGSLFIGGQVYEFTTFVREGLGYTTNVASSAFYTLTGFHGVHVTHRHRDVGGYDRSVGTWPHSPRDGPRRSRSSGLYWHFVDVVWILIFTVVYLIK